MTVGPAPDEVLRRLELTITRKLDGLLQGDYRGLVPGHGSDPGETRPYQPGDDTRRIDWNVTARMQVPHVRETIADRELETWLLIDQSASLDFGTADCEKRDLVLNAAGAVGFLTSRNGNRLGAVLLQPGAAPVIIPARTGRVHLQAVLHRVITAPRVDGGGPTNLAAGIERLGATMRRRGLAVVISDWLDPTPWQMPLRRLGVRHDVLAVEVLDPRELALATSGCSSWSIPRRATCTRCRRPTPACASDSPPRRQQRERSRRRCSERRRPPRAAHRPRLAARPGPLRVVRREAQRRTRIVVS